MRKDLLQEPLPGRIGKFEEADKGTLFLDEIGELDINLQAKLLRVLQEREITRVGANNVLPINVRIIVATHKNLLEEVKNKTFQGRSLLSFDWFTHYAAALT